MKKKRKHKNNQKEESLELEEKIEEQVEESEEKKEPETLELENQVEESIEDEEKNETDESLEEDYEYYKPKITSSTYNETVDNLIDEVKLFHGEGEIDIQPKKAKKGLWITLIILFLIIIICVVWMFLKSDDKKEPKKNNEKEDVIYNYTYKEVDSKIEFYKDEKLIDTYTCMSKDCSVYSIGRYNYFSTDPTIIALQDDNSVFLYNYVDKKTVSSFYTTLQNLYKDDKTVAFIATNTEKLVGIIDINGNVIVPFEYDMIGYSISGGDVTDYSYDNNLITALKDSKWGLISLKDGAEILKLQYEDIYYNGFNCVVIKEKDYWYLVDLNGDKILESGYDIIIPTKSYIFVAKDDIFNILNYKGDNIINNEIPTYIKGFRNRTTSITPTFKIETDGTVITIYIMKDNDEYIEYKFNTVNGELTEVIR